MPCKNWSSINQNRGRGLVEDRGKRLDGGSLTDKKRENGDFLKGGGAFLYPYVRERGETQKLLHVGWAWS